MARILVVDDDMDALEMLAALLRSDRHDVTTAHEAESALQIYQVARNNSHAFDLILMDLALPYTNGIEIMQKVRDAGDWETKVAFLTGYPISSMAQDGIMDSVEALRPCGIWNKPMDAVVLLGNVRECLEKGA